MNLLQLLTGTLTTNDSVDSVSKKTGVSNAAIKKLLFMAVPLLISYLTKNASKKEGAQSLLGALMQHTSTATVSQQIKNADSDDGAKIIAHILGKDQNTIVNSLASDANLTTAQVNSVLNNIAPAILNSLSTVNSAAMQKPAANKVDLSDGIDLSDIADQNHISCFSVYLFPRHRFPADQDLRQFLQISGITMWKQPDSIPVCQITGLFIIYQSGPEA